MTNHCAAILFLAFSHHEKDLPLSNLQHMCAYYKRA